MIKAVKKKGKILRSGRSKKQVKNSFKIILKEYERKDIYVTGFEIHMVLQFTETVLL